MKIMASHSETVLDVDEVSSQSFGEHLKDNRWALYVVTFVVLLFILAFAVDTIAGPLTD